MIPVTYTYSRSLNILVQLSVGLSVLANDMNSYLLCICEYIFVETT